jgi:hypothetical protein
VEIDLVGHEGGTAAGEFCFTLTVTDIATGWTINQSVRNKAQRWVFQALTYVSAQFPFPIRGIDSDNGSEFINEHLLRYCTEHQITFTRSRPYNKNDGAHVEQKNWALTKRPGRVRTHNDRALTGGNPANPQHTTSTHRRGRALRRRRTAPGRPTARQAGWPTVTGTSRSRSSTLAVATGVLGEWQNREEPPGQDQP